MPSTNYKTIAKSRVIWIGVDITSVSIYLRRMLGLNQILDVCALVNRICKVNVPYFSISHYAPISAMCNV
jgi:hypothetical protein